MNRRNFIKYSSLNGIFFAFFLVLTLLDSNVLAESAKHNPSAIEQRVHRQIITGLETDLKGGMITGEFLSKLLQTFGPKKNIPTSSVIISNAIISSDLTVEDITFENKIMLVNCHFTGNFVLPGNSFKKDFSITNSVFDKSFNISASVFERNFFAENARFTGKDQIINFDKVKVAESVYFSKSIFNGSIIFRDTNVKEIECSDVQFLNSEANFYNMKITEHAYFQNTVFNGEVNFGSIDVGKDFNATAAQFKSETGQVTFFSMKVSGNAYFENAVFAGGFDFTLADIGGSLELNNVQAQNPGAKKLFTGMKADTLTWDEIKIKPPYDLGGIVFRLFYASNEQQLIDLIENANYSPDTYTNLEAYFRRMNMSDAAESIFMNGKRKERDKKLNSHPIKYFPEYVFSWILCVTVNYGKWPSGALVWSLLFIIVGIIVFRKEEWMIIKDKDKTNDFKDKYNPFWYSVSLFLPIVNLGDSEVWMPKLDRTKTRIYMRLHIILGYLLIPIGLAAWTGILK